MKKRLAALIIAAGLLCSCGTNTAEETTTTTVTEVTTTEAEVQQTVSGDAEAEEKPAANITNHVVEGNTDGLTPAVWQVTDPESGNSIKMMGTIHLIPEDTAVVPQYVMDIYNQCDSVAVEYDITKVQTDMVIQIMYLSYFMLSDGTTIHDHISPETYEAAKAFLDERGLYMEAYDGYNAAFWSNLISSGAILSLDGMKETGIDLYFVELAKADGKDVRSIEKLETQMDAITFATDELCEYDMNTMVQLSVEEIKETFMGLYNLWATGDVDGMYEMDNSSTSEYPEEIAADYEVYNQKLLYDRNVGMADVAEEYIKNGDNVFYMVGFAHYAGDGSVIDLLEERGYTVERIY